MNLHRCQFVPQRRIDGNDVLERAHVSHEKCKILDLRLKADDRRCRVGMREEDGGETDVRPRIDHELWRREAVVEVVLPIHHHL